MNTVLHDVLVLLITNLLYEPKQLWFTNQSLYHRSKVKSAFRYLNFIDTSVKITALIYVCINWGGLITKINLAK